MRQLIGLGLVLLAASVVQASVRVELRPDPTTAVPAPTSTTPRSTVSADTSPNATGHRGYAILIGCDNYQNVKFRLPDGSMCKPQDLQCCVDDAIALAGVLQQQPLFAGRVQVLMAPTEGAALPATPYQVTPLGLMNRPNNLYVRRILGETALSAHAGDVVVVYFSGHTYYDKSRDELFLILPDSDNVGAAADLRCLTFDQVVEDFIGCKADVVFVLDGSGSGVAAECLSRAWSFQNGNRYLLCSSRAGEEAGVYPDASASLFTKRLVDLLHQAAEDKVAGGMSLLDLFIRLQHSPPLKIDPQGTAVQHICCRALISSDLPSYPIIVPAALPQASEVAPASSPPVVASSGPKGYALLCDLVDSLPTRSGISWNDISTLYPAVAGIYQALQATPLFKEVEVYSRRAAAQDTRQRIDRPLTESAATEKLRILFELRKAADAGRGDPVLLYFVGKASPGEGSGPCLQLSDENGITHGSQLTLDDVVDQFRGCPANLVICWDGPVDESPQLRFELNARAADTLILAPCRVGETPPQSPGRSTVFEEALADTLRESSPASEETFNRVVANSVVQRLAAVVGTVQHPVLISSVHREEPPF